MAGFFENRRAQAIQLALEGKVNGGERAEIELARPKTRADCVEGPRPCPFVSCRWHLLFSITDKGTIVFHHDPDDLEGMTDTCALDIADRGGTTLEEIGDLMCITRERIRQIEGFALRKVKRHPIVSPSWLGDY